MIDRSIREEIWNNSREFNSIGLLKLMEDSGANFVDRNTIGIYGFATYHTVYLDLKRIKQFPPTFLFFVILHETAHFKRITKMGGKDGIIQLLSITDFDEFVDAVINEEVIADRYACYVFNVLNGRLLSREVTQNLHHEQARANYKNNNARFLFGVVKNDEETYHRLCESFFV